MITHPRWISGIVPGVTYRNIALGMSVITVGVNDPSTSIQIPDVDVLVPWTQWGQKIKNILPHRATEICKHCVLQNNFR